MFKLKHFIILLPGLLLGFFLSASQALAINLPIADYGGGFTFTKAVTSGKPQNQHDHWLTLDSLLVNGVDYLGGGSSSTDAIQGMTIDIGGTLTTPKATTNADPFQSLTLGDGIFKIWDGATSYLTGTITTPVDFQYSPLFPSLERVNIPVAITSINNGTLGSVYLDQLQTNGVTNLTLYVELSFPGSGTHFSADTSGTAQGKLYPTNAIPVVPEPSSLILLVSGLAGLIGLRARRK